jgi:hypothetical protein
MSDIALANAAAYGALHELRLVERLGFGIHGTVHAVQREGKQDQSAIKALHSAEFYFRERAVYQRLQDALVTDVMGFHVPQLIRFDDSLLVIEMTIVTRPFVLDFASAYLDRRPDFAEEIWTQWETEKREQFGERWTKVRAVLAALEEIGIYLTDVTPGNVAFAD